MGEFLVVEPRKRQSAQLLLDLLTMEDVTDIDENMPANSESKLGLALQGAVDRGDDERARVEDGSKSGEPALVVVLGTVIAKNWIGDMRLEYGCGPALPLGKQLIQR